MGTDYYISFNKDQYYHIFNRGNNGERIFYTPENYNFFLRRFGEYLFGSVDLFGYCLLPNHFHFLIKVREKDIISEKFRLLFLSYSKAINKQTGRTGSLFQKRFKRTIIEDTPSLCRAIVYIHTNPAHHNMIGDFRTYKYSSYEILISDEETKLKKEEVLNWFGDKDTYIKSHILDMPDF